ncbi:hypothetical protein JCM10207_006239 [Rhodosporidiobolus poonsookiae]
MGNSDGDTKPIAVPTAHLTALPRPTPLPSDSHLRGADNYDVWCIQMRGLLGADAWGIMTGDIQRPNGEGGIAWDKLNEFAVSSIIISCHASVIHHFAECEHSAHAYWSALRDNFRPTDAQGSLRLLTRYWSLSLATASPEAFDAFAKEYKAMLASLKAAKVDLETIYSSHLLAALPSSLNSLQTTLAVTNQGTLPKTDAILEVIDNPPPSPCPACKAMHWLRDCPKREEDRRQRRAAARLARAQPPADPASPPPSSAPAAKLAQLLEHDGVEGWLSTLSPTSATPSRLATLDSGATHSMVGDVSLFANLRRCTPSPVGGLSGRNGLRVTGVGTVSIRLDTGRLVTLHNVLLVPGISANLISTSQLYDIHGVTCTFAKTASLTRNGAVVATGSRLSNNLYRLDGVLVKPAPSASALLASSRAGAAELITWHRRFAHLSARSLKSLAASEHVTGLDATTASVDGHTCNVCHVSRSSRLPFPRSESETSSRLELVHSDILAINVPSLGGRRYVVTFVDDYSRMLWVEPLARKSDVLAAFNRFKAIAENESGLRIQRFRSDNGGEYISNAFRDLLAEHGIVHEPPPPYSPQSNGVAERVNRSIVEGIIAFLSQSGAPKELWAEALLAFTFVKNRSPHAGIGGAVPLSRWRGRPARVDMLRVWGCRAWHTVTKGRSKLDDKAIPLIFVGYNGDTAAYRLYDPHSKRTLRSRDTRFVENEFPFLTFSSSHASPSGVITPADQGLSPVREAGAMPARHAQPSTPAAHAPAMPAAPARPRHESVMPVTPPPRLDYARAVAPSPPAPPILAAPDSPDPIDFLSDPFSQEVEGLLAAVADDLEAGDDAFALPSSDPRNHREAARDPDSERWREGEQGEFDSLRDEYNVFHAVNRSTVPAGAKILGCRFVYRRKKDQHGRVTGHKVRLVAQGFSQRPGVDFRETFAPVAKFTSIRVLLSPPARHRLHVHQADVDKAYLHGSLDEERYMRVPEGIDDPSLAGKVLKLDRALYGLKQAGRVWNHRIHASLVALGYSRTRSDACVYVRRDGAALHYIALYVDDLLFVSPSTAEVDRIKGGLKTKYGIKDLGEAKFILGIQVHRRADKSIFLLQRAYLEDVLLRLGQSGACTAPTPMMPNLQLASSPPDHNPDAAFRRRYMQAVGSLMYAMLGTRPDLAYAVGVLGRHASRPDESHWSAVVRVCQYIKGTLDYGLEYSPNDAPLTGFEAYSDSDWGACVNTARSTMGYAFVLASGAVSWSSKLQSPPLRPRALTLLGDNQGANALSRDPQFHDRTRHLRLTNIAERDKLRLPMLSRAEKEDISLDIGTSGFFSFSPGHP